MFPWHECVPGRHVVNDSKCECNGLGLQVNHASISRPLGAPCQFCSLHQMKLFLSLAHKYLMLTTSGTRQSLFVESSKAESRLQARFKSCIVRSALFVEAKLDLI